MFPQDIPCKLCGSATTTIGSKTSSYSGREYFFLRCTSCQFAFVSNPWTDYASIYNADYYAGKGADPYVDYLYELEAPRQSVRFYEWRGIVRAVRSLVPLSPSTRWLDYGCGKGGLMRYCQQELGRDLQIVGFDEGWIAGKSEDYGIHVLTRSELNALPAATFDIITAIEVIEHITAPRLMLREIRRLLRPGGLFFFTTGNAKPYRRNLLKWRYVYPDIHVSYFEPETLRRALTECGLMPARRGFLPGYSDIIRFKCLKALGLRKRSGWERCLPWALISRLVDWRLGLTDHPLAWGASPGPARLLRSHHDHPAGH
jgi:SAM-dependent methyltransferase